MAQMLRVGIGLVVGWTLDGARVAKQKDRQCGASGVNELMTWWETCNA